MFEGFTPAFLTQKALVAEVAIAIRVYMWLTTVLGFPELFKKIQDFFVLVSVKKIAVRVTMFVFFSAHHIGFSQILKNIEAKGNLFRRQPLT